MEYFDSVSLGGRSGPRSLGSESPRLIIQKSDTHICGQACVAMALDVLPDAAAKLMHVGTGGTKTKQLINALSEYYHVDDRLRIVKSDSIPPKCICKLLISKNRSHWVLHWNGFIYDPSWGVFHYPQYLNHIEAFKCRISSALEIIKDKWGILYCPYAIY